MRTSMIETLFRWLLVELNFMITIARKIINLNKAQCSWGETLTSDQDDSIKSEDPRLACREQRRRIAIRLEKLFSVFFDSFLANRLIPTTYPPRKGSYPHGDAVAVPPQTLQRAIEKYGGSPCPNRAVQFLWIQS